MVGADPWQGADQVRMFIAHFVGGSGGRDNNVYTRLMTRLGYSGAAERLSRCGCYHRIGDAVRRERRRGRPDDPVRSGSIEQIRHRDERKLVHQPEELK
ncbi:hypothetical protein ACQPW1_30515 [Nocardia sp. CA-128927]|uniref:hypothetical protein n=1 Tax=Nocardia sp. CA-128927 TaxID=3239975 RepID=UPI003D977803